MKRKYSLEILGVIVAAIACVAGWLALPQIQALIQQPPSTDQGQHTQQVVIVPTYTPYPTYTPFPTFTPPPIPTIEVETATVPSDQNIPTEVPTPIILEPSPSPIGGAIIGALLPDGSIADRTSRIGLYPKTLADANNELHGDPDRAVFATTDRLTGLSSFAGLTPGKYIVCFYTPGGSINVGEITIEPYVIIRQNFYWRDFRIGESCKL